MSRMVTTIGDLGLRAHGRGFAHSIGPSRPTRRRRPPPNLRFDDDIDGLMEIGDLTVDTPDTPSPIPPSNFPPGTFDVPGSGEIVVPEVVITPGPDFQPSPPSSSSSAAAAAPSKAAWARGDGSYILQPGNTLSGLAATYLSAAARWPEIWNVQSASYKGSHTPDKIFAGEVIAMPAEAQAKARAMGLFGIGANLLGRGFSGAQVAVAAAGVVGLGTLIHFAMK